MKRLSSFMGMTEKAILIKSFILSNFNYCPLVWHFCSKRDMDKMEKIQKRALRMVLDEYESDYETLLQKAKMQTLHCGQNKNPKLYSAGRIKTYIDI